MKTLLSISGAILAFAFLTMNADAKPKIVKEKDSAGAYDAHSSYCNGCGRAIEFDENGKEVTVRTNEGRRDQPNRSGVKQGDR